MSTPLVEPAPSPAPVDGRALLIKGAVGILAMMVVFGVLGAFFHEPVEALAGGFVAATGAVGLVLGVALLDSVPSPFPPDLLMGIGLLGGMGFWNVSLLASLGSVAGGLLAWTLGGKLRHTARFKRLLAGSWQQPWLLVQRNAVTAVVLGALTPLPFSVTCYAAGAAQMGFWRFLPLTLLRVPRMVVYLLLMDLGWIGGS